MELGHPGPAAVAHPIERAEHAAHAAGADQALHREPSGHDVPGAQRLRSYSAGVRLHTGFRLLIFAVVVAACGKGADRAGEDEPSVEDQRAEHREGAMLVAQSAADTLRAGLRADFSEVVATSLRLSDGMVDALHVPEAPPRARAVLEALERGQAPRGASAAELIAVVDHGGKLVALLVDGSPVFAAEDQWQQEDNPGHRLVTHALAAEDIHHAQVAFGSLGKLGAHLMAASLVFDPAAGRLLGVVLVGRLLSDRLAHRFAPGDDLAALVVGDRLVGLSDPRRREPLETAVERTGLVTEALAKGASGPRLVTLSSETDEYAMRTLRFERPSDWPPLPYTDEPAAVISLVKVTGLYR